MIFKKKKLQKVLVFLRFFKVPVIKYKYTENVKERGKEFIFYEEMETKYRFISERDSECD